MSFYKICFYHKPDDRWLNVAKRSKIMPSIIEMLIADNKPIIVDGIKLDAICEWDQTICKTSLTQSVIDYWPVDI